MDLIELSHRTTAIHATRRFKIDTGVVDRHGTAWSIERAAQLIISHQARFLYQGERVWNLDMLPEGTDITAGGCPL
jgi:hypothetical protein